MVNLAWMSDPTTPMSSDGSHTKFYDSSLGASPSNAPLLAHSLFSRQHIPSCAGECIASADLRGCATTDNACLCKSEAFLSSTAACIERTCTASDLAKAIAAAEAICAAVGVTLSKLPTGSATATGPSSPAGTSVASSSSTPVSSSGGSGTVMIAPIVGGVVGFLALVAFIVVGLIWFRKSRRKRVWVRRSQSPTSVELSLVLPSSPIEPFPIPSAAPQNSGQLQSSNKSASPGGPLAPPSMKQLQATGLIPTTTQTPSLMQMSSSSASTPIGGLDSHRIVGNTSRVLLHQDSGIRLPRQAGENEVVEMPPLYTSI